MTLHVAFVTDRSYLPWCATAILSCLEVHPAGAAVAHVVHDGSVPTADVDALSGLGPPGAVSVHVVDAALVADLPEVDRFGRIVWLRFVLEEVVPPSVDRVLYLDADTLVVDSLTKLETIDLRGNGLAAVPNVMAPDDETRLRGLGLQDAERFFNSGVLLFDLEQLRARPLLPRAREVLREFGDAIRWPDQDVLNVVYADAWTPLHPRFNVMNSFYDWGRAATDVLGGDARRAALASPAVVHFEGPSACKPWHRLSSHLYRDRYREILSRTPWCDVSLDGDDRATRLIAALPRAMQLPLYEQLVLIRRGARPSLRGLLRTVRRRRRERDSVR